MSTTRYITATSEGLITIIARAVDPEGNTITEQVSLNSSVPVSFPPCYRDKISLSNVQDNIDSACAQFGVTNTYYLGTPRNTLYTTTDCSNIATDGFYKTENDGWVNVAGGAIRQRGVCSAVRSNKPTVNPQTVRQQVQEVINRFGNVDATATAVRRVLAEQQLGGSIGVPPIPTSQRLETIERFVAKPTFSEPSPSTVPPDPIPKYTSQKQAGKGAKAQQIPEQPIITSTQEIVASTQPISISAAEVPPLFTPAPPPIGDGRIFGCTDRRAINFNPRASVDDGSCQYQPFAFGSEL